MRKVKSKVQVFPNPIKVLKAAVREAYRDHKKAGIDPVIWKNGRVVRLKLSKKKAA